MTIDTVFIVDAMDSRIHDGMTETDAASEVAEMMKVDQSVVLDVWYMYMNG